MKETEQKVGYNERSNCRKNKFLRALIEVKMKVRTNKKELASR